MNMDIPRHQTGTTKIIVPKFRLSGSKIFFQFNFFVSPAVLRM